MTDSRRKELDIQEKIAILSDSELMLYLKTIVEEVTDRYEEAMALMSN